MENYKETEWSAMSGLEEDLKQLEASYAKEHGDHEESVSGITRKVYSLNLNHCKPEIIIFQALLVPFRTCIMIYFALFVKI